MRLRQAFASVAAACLLAIASCAPRQEAAYSLAPPASEAGRQCVSESCLPTAEACRQDCAGWTNFCRDDARNDALSDFAARSRVDALTRNPERLTRPERTFAQCDYRERSCQADCQGKYRSCFTSCGGQVTGARL